MEPDVAGFVDAQVLLRRGLGADVTFIMPGTPVWPEDTPLDPETEAPYDPTIEPEASASAPSASALIRVGVALGGRTEGDDVAIGTMRETEGLLIVDVSDHDLASGADECLIRNERYAIQQRRPRGIAGIIHEWLYFVEIR